MQAAFPPFFRRRLLGTTALLLVLATFLLLIPGVALSQSAPSITTVAVTSDPGDDDTYAKDEVIQITLTFSEAVDVTGSPQIKIDMDPAEWGEKTATYARGGGSNSLVFTHTVVEPNFSSQGIAVLQNGLELNGGTIRAGSADADMSHDGLAHDANHKVNWQLAPASPYVYSVAITSDAGDDNTYAKDDVIEVALAFSQNVNVAGTPSIKIDMDPAHWGEKTASYSSGSGSNALTFTHTVVEPNISTQGIAVLQNGLQLDGGTIQAASSSDDASLSHDGRDHDDNHKVDWRLEPAEAESTTNAAPVVNTQAEEYSAFIDNLGGTVGVPRGTLVSKGFYQIFSDPDGDELTYTASVSDDHRPLIDTLSITLPEDVPNAREGVFPRLFFIADTDGDWDAVRPRLPDDRFTVTVTLTATDPGGLSASIEGDFTVYWEPNYLLRTPTGLTHERVSATELRLSWNAYPSVTYEVQSRYLDTEKGWHTRWTQEQITEAGASSATIGGINCDTDYDFRLRAVNGDDAGPFATIEGVGTFLVAGNSGDTWTGSDDDECYRGGDGDDTIAGGHGDDVLRGNDGDDVIYGDEAPAQTVAIATPPSHRSTSFGADFGYVSFYPWNTTFGGFDADTPLALITKMAPAADAHPHPQANNPTQGDDVIYGNNGNDTISGQGGNDKIFGGLGNDTLNGNSGNDTLYGDEGNDVLRGHNGDDKLFAGSGDDEIYAGAGSDVLYGDPSHDRAVAGDDTLWAGDGHDFIDGGAGADKIYGDSSLHTSTDELPDWITEYDNFNLNYYRTISDWAYPGDTLSYYGSPAGVTVKLHTSGQSGEVNGSGGHAQGDLINGIENIVGSNYNDRLTGGIGPNLFRGGLGADIMDGNGHNQYNAVDYRDSDCGVIVTIREKPGNVYGGDGRNNPANCSGKTSTAHGDRLTNLASVHGSNHDDVISGVDFNVSISRLFGHKGDDIIHTGDGAHRIYGGDGTDTVSFSRKTNSDQVFVDLTIPVDRYTTPANANANATICSATEPCHVDSLLQNAGGYHKLFSIENVIGSQGNDTIKGGRSFNILRGGPGNDTLISVGFNGDHLYGDAGNDTLNAGEGYDRMDGGSGTDTVSYSAATAAVDVNLETGGSGDIWPSTTYASGDTYISIENVIGSSHNDTITGDRRANTLSGGNGVDTINGGNGNDRLYGDAGNDDLHGNNGNDRLNGGAGDDTLEGGLGNDHLYGGANNDTLHGNAGTDTFYFYTSFGTDTIQDFTSNERIYICMGTAGKGNGTNQANWSVTGSTNAVITVTFEGSTTGTITLHGVPDNVADDRISWRSTNHATCSVD